ncbi:hypothetical protein ACFL5Q_02600 [Planctomycetota bacterium]
MVKRRGKSRRGVSLLEISTAGILLAAMMAVSLQFLGATAAQRQGLQARRMAVREAANVMERVCARAWEELTPQGLGDVELSSEVQERLFESALEIEVAEAEELGGKRITVVVGWLNRADRSNRSVRLVAWRHPGGGD